MAKKILIGKSFISLFSTILHFQKIDFSILKIFSFWDDRIILLRVFERRASSCTRRLNYNVIKCTFALNSPEFSWNLLKAFEFSWSHLNYLKQLFLWKKDPLPPLGFEPRSFYCRPVDCSEPLSYVGIENNLLLRDINAYKQIHIY